jgi:hypothetical protein
MYWNGSVTRHLALQHKTMMASIARKGLLSRSGISSSIGILNPEDYVHRLQQRYESSNSNSNSTTRLVSSESATAADNAWRSHPSMIKLKFREQLNAVREKSLLGGGSKRIDKQHNRGSLTARERIELLFDPGSFHELDQLKAHRCTEFGMEDESKQFPGDGIVTGHGTVNGRIVYAFSQGAYVSLLLYCVFWFFFYAQYH